MSAIVKVKSVLASLAHCAGVDARKLRRRSESNIPILMYHRVVPAAQMAPSVQAGMIVEPATLELHIRYLQRIFEIVPLSDLILGRETSTRLHGTKPLCVLTFDDGWSDFYKHAFPILKVQRTPATVFLPTEFVGTDRWFWTDRLGFLLECSVRLRVSPKNGLRLRDPLLSGVLSTRGSHAQRLERAIALLKPLRVERIEEMLRELADVLRVDQRPEGRAFLSWQEVEEMHSSGLVAFGSHTATHPILTTLTESEVAYELRESMNALVSRKVANPAFMCFCYPNGSFSTRLTEMVKDAGYHLAVTTQGGWNHAGANPYTLRRIGIHEDMAATEAMFAARLANA